MRIGRQARAAKRGRLRHSVRVHVHWGRDWFAYVTSLARILELDSRWTG
uniref:Uncharacterized protein n=1 Tax=Setaria viridis TaxID=4556 RepID=A0A4U6V979_SETVI|nr:hypothetical protein SEVIR_3G147466v2 [Setaria viridis]